MYRTHGRTYLQKKYQEIKEKYSDNCISNHYITKCFIYYQFIQYTEKYAIGKSACAAALSIFYACLQFNLLGNRYEVLFPKGKVARV
jgi:hypothetical protein